MIGPLSYIGGKRRIAKQLVTLIPKHTTYVEPFAGGAQVFFHKPRSTVEVLNDLDEAIVNFLRICQRHPQELSRMLRWQRASRRLVGWHQQQSPDVLTDIERAAWFFYLQKNTWGGKRTRQNFHFGVTKPPSYTPSLLAKRLALRPARHLLLLRPAVRRGRPSTNTISPTRSLRTSPRGWPGSPVGFCCRSTVAPRLARVCAVLLP
jgi:DNA adenine methylase